MYEVTLKGNWIEVMWRFRDARRNDFTGTSQTRGQLTDLYERKLITPDLTDIRFIGTMDPVYNREKQ